MTDLLTSRTRRTTATGSTPATPRPLWLSAGAAALLSAGGVLGACMALGLVGWFASDSGAHGDTRDALRVGADAWLLAHGARLQLAASTVGLVPLGLSAACGYAAFRGGRWAGRTSSPEDALGTGLATVVLAGLYGVVALVTALLASTTGGQLTLGRAFLGGVLVGLLGGGAGLASTTPAARRGWRRVPETLRATLRGSVAVVALMLAAGSALVVVALLLDLGEAANVLSRLHPDAAGAALYTLVVAAFAPNAALLGGSYLLGPGFAVGTGTVVSPAMVVLGPVPAFPLLAALPAAGPGPSWATALVGVPVLVGGLAAALVVRRHPDRRWEVGAVRGLASGVAGAALLTGLVVLAGGSAGPGRMALVGAPAVDTLAAAVVALGGGGLVGGVLATWRARRAAAAEPPERESAATSGRDPSEEDTVVL